MKPGGRRRSVLGLMRRRTRQKLAVRRTLLNWRGYYRSRYPARSKSCSESRLRQSRVESQSPAMLKHRLNRILGPCRDSMDIAVFFPHEIKIR